MILIEFAITKIRCSLPIINERWEKILEYDVGFKAGFFGKLEVSKDYSSKSYSITIVTAAITSNFFYDYKQNCDSNNNGEWKIASREIKRLVILGSSLELQLIKLGRKWFNISW